MENQVRGSERSVGMMRFCGTTRPAAVAVVMVFWIRVRPGEAVEGGGELPLRDQEQRTDQDDER